MEDLIKKINETIKDMHGWCTPEKASMMAEIVVEHRPTVSVEIGVWGGKSLMVLALAHCHIQHGHCFGVDPWTVEDALRGVEHPDNREWWSNAPFEDVYRDCLKRLVDAEVTHRCTVHRTTSEQASQLFHDVNLLHIDGNHTEDSSVIDVFCWLPKIPSGGHVIFDDVDWNEGNNPTTRRAVSFVEEQCEKIGMVGNCAIFRKR